MLGEDSREGHMARNFEGPLRAENSSWLTAIRNEEPQFCSDKELGCANSMSVAEAPDIFSGASYGPEWACAR